MKIKNYDEILDKFKILCTCEIEIEKDLSKKEIKFLQEFGEYENLSIQCSNCGRIHFFNMNLPESDYEEIEFEDTIMSFEEINKRKVLRDLMWSKREDLKGLDRATVNLQKKHILDEWKARKENDSTI